MSGLAPGATLPDTWSKSEHVTWSIDVPGRGWSSPIVAGTTVFLTSAISGKPFKQPSPGIYGNDYIAELRAQGLSTAEINARVRARDNEIPDESGPVRYMVYAFDAATGKMIWEREAYQGLPVGGRHRKNTYASETPFTDGERVVRVLRREHRPVRLRARWHAAVEADVAAAADLSRFRHGIPRRSCTTGACTCCRTARRSAS